MAELLPLLIEVVPVFEELGFVYLLLARSTVTPTPLPLFMPATTLHPMVVSVLAVH